MTRHQAFALALLLTLFGWGESQAQLQENWVARYRGPSGGNDSARCIAVDTNGNVVVFGPSSGATADDVSALIKYDRSGNQLWVARDSQAFPDYTLARTSGGRRSMCLDGEGNIIVTGVFWPQTNNSSDFITVKYRPDGTKLWSAFYNGPPDVSPNIPPDYSYDVPSELVVDGAGNVYVTGSSITPVGADYVTIKYDSTGQQRWTRRYDGPAHGQDVPAAIGVDTNGNVFVSGSSSGADLAHDFLTIKYDPDGNELWTARYDGPFHSADEAGAMVVDTSGNVYVVGNSVGSGHCAGNSDAACQDITAVKYDTHGSQLWVTRHERLGESEQATGAAVNDEGDLYVSAASGGLLKFDKDGGLVWASGFHLSEIWGGHAGATALDSQGNVYVTGHANVGGGLGYATAMYDADGNRRWIGGYSVPGTYGHLAKALAVDASGKVHVTGGSVSVITPFSDDFVTVQYSPVNVAGAPVINSLPSSITVSTGENATLVATATGEEPLQYRWVRRGWPQRDSHGPTLTLSNLSVTDISDWSVEVTNTSGTNISRYVRVMVNGAPVISNQPQDQTSLEIAGTITVFYMEAVGTPPLFFQWLKEGVPVGLNRDYFDLSNPRAADSGTYSVVVTNAYGSVTSAPARLSVLPPVPIVSQQPQSQTNVRGASVSFVVGAYNQTSLPDPPRYQWEFNGNSLPGQTNTTLIITNAQRANEGFYRAVISNPFGSISSAPATLVLLDPGPGWFANVQPIRISDDDDAFPYPSEIEVSGVSGHITNLSVSLIGLEHSWSSDIDALLVGPGGQSVLLMSDAGSGISVAGINLTFNKDAALIIPQPGPLTSGRFRPANYGQFPDYFSAPAPPGPYGTDLSVFDGTNPNGAWRLFVHDDDEDASGLIAGGWRIDLQGDGTPPGIEPGALDHWHVSHSSITNFTMGVTTGPGGFVAVGNRGTIFLSPDGYEWTGRESGINVVLNDAVSDGGTLVAVGAAGAILTSTDGSNWVRRVSATAVTLHDVTYGDGRFVAVGESGAIQVSLDSGVSWQPVSSGTNRTLLGVAYGPGVFVSVGVQGVIRISTNGLNWVAGISTNTLTLNAVTYGGGLFVAVGDNRTILTSSDGRNWTRQTVAPGIGAPFQDVIYASGTFVCGGVTGILFSSINGQDWTARSFPTGQHIYGLAFNGATFVAACNGSTNVIFQSDPVFPQEPRLVRPPLDTVVLLGGKTNLTVTAVGTSPLTYQWLRDNAPLPGATNRMLTFSNTQVSAEGSYRVTVANALGSIGSTAARLTVGVPPTVVVQPLNQGVIQGGAVTFSVEVNGAAPFSYGWHRPSSGVAAAPDHGRQSFWTVTNVQPGSVGNYGVYVTNAFGLAVSRAARLSILPDTDADGLPDAWEAAHGLDTNNLEDATLDLDADGVTNLDEYRSGTNPTNTSSALKLRQSHTNATVLLGFDAESNKTYTVQRREAFDSSEWSKLIDVVGRTNRQAETVIDPIGTTNRFYRVVTPRQP